MDKKHAIVIGGSIAGMISAQVLSKYFETVTIIEKDRVEELKPRNGTPQANHIHTLLVKGKKILSETFPEFEKDIVDAGAFNLDFIRDGQYFIDGHWTPRFTSGLNSYFCSRILLESIIRKQIHKNKKIRFNQAVFVTGLIPDDKKTKILGVKTKRTGIDYSDENIVNGDIIVDASGRNSKNPEWLQDLGYSIPEETHVDSNIGYATRCYKIPQEFRDLKQFIAVLNHPPFQPKMGGILPIEGEKWKVIMYSIGKDLPSTNETEFLEFAKTLRNSKVYDMIKNAEPESAIYGYRAKGSRLVHYEKFRSWPENFIIIGDAVCTFNPFYGQGMTVAAIGGQLLDEFLKKNFNRMQLNCANFALRFQKELYKKNLYPWLLATGEDFRWPTTKGPKPNVLIRLIQRYIDNILYLSPHSKLATRSFQEMMQMTRSPIVLFHPIIMMQLIIKSIRKPRNQAI